MKYIIRAKNIEYLKTMDVEAENEDEARSKFINAWNDGMLTVIDNSLEVDVTPDDISHCSNCQAEVEEVEELIDGRWRVTELVCENCGTREEI